MSKKERILEKFRNNNLQDTECVDFEGAMDENTVDFEGIYDDNIVDFE